MAPNRRPSCCRSSSRCGTRRTTSSGRSAPPPGLRHDGRRRRDRRLRADRRRRQVDRPHARARRRAGRRRPHVRVVHHPERNRKLGGSIKTGFATPAATSCCTPTPTCPSTWRSCRGRSGCCASTTPTWSAPTASTAPARATLRAVYTFFYNLLIRTMFGVKARDINFAFKLLRRRVLDDIELRSEGSFIDAELIIRAIRWASSSCSSASTTSHGPGRVDAQLAGVIATIIAEMVRLRGELQAIARSTDAWGGHACLAPRRHGVSLLGWRTGKAAIREPLDLPLPDRPLVAPGSPLAVVGTVVVAGVAGGLRRATAGGRPDDSAAAASPVLDEATPAQTIAGRVASGAVGKTTSRPAARLRLGGHDVERCRTGSGARVRPRSDRRPVRQPHRDGRVGVREARHGVPRAEARAS